MPWKEYDNGTRITISKYPGGPPQSISPVRHSSVERVPNPQGGSIERITMWVGPHADLTKELPGAPWIPDGYTGPEYVAVFERRTGVDENGSFDCTTRNRDMEKETLRRALEGRQRHTQRKGVA